MGGPPCVEPPCKAWALLRAIYHMRELYEHVPKEMQVGLVNEHNDWFQVRIKTQELHTPGNVFVTMTDKNDETFSVKRLQGESGICLLSNGDVQSRKSLVYPQYDVNWICLAFKSEAFDVFSKSALASDLSRGRRGDCYQMFPRR